MGKVTVYGVGGYDPSKPNNNVVEEYEIPDPEVMAPAGQTMIPQAAIDELKSKVQNPSINSIAELKTALKEFLDGIVEV